MIIIGFLYNLCAKRALRKEYEKIFDFDFDVEMAVTRSLFSR